MVAETPQETLLEEEYDLDALVDRAWHEAYGRYGYVTEEGKPDVGLVVDKLLEVASQAIATKRADRASVCVMRRGLSLHAFPDVVGPEGWADQEDPALAEKLWKRIDGDCWRTTAMKPDGLLEQRITSEYRYVLCRTKVNPHRTDAIYITRDLGCLLEDVVKPQRAEQMTRANRDAALVAMLIELVPEHGERFDRELAGGLKTALESARAITKAALESSAFDAEDEDDASEDDEGE